MDASELAKKMLEWEQKKEELDVLENTIKAAVLEIGKTQNVGNVRASYSQGRRSFDDHRAMMMARDLAVEQGDENKIAEINTAIQMHTVTTAITNWNNVRDTLKLERIVASQGEPSVTVKLI